MTPEPYTDTQKDNQVIREFNNPDPSELIWHRDKENRVVTILEGEKWMLQFDDELPFILEKNKLYYIPKMTYHRIIKGDGNLKIKIQEL
jgi:hypothetical protein